MKTNKANKTCGTCEWYAHFEGVCVNDASEYCVDFTSEDDSCEFWEEKNENLHKRFNNK